MTILRYSIIFKSGETQQVCENTCLPFYVDSAIARRLGYDAPFYLPPLEQPEAETPSAEPLTDGLYQRIATFLGKGGGKERQRQPTRSRKGIEV